MGNIFLKRVFQVVIIALISSSIGFLMMHLLPGDMAMRIAAGRYGPDGITAEIAQSVRDELGLNRPLYEQFFLSIYNFLKLDLGYSLVSGQSVINELKVQLGYSLLLTLSTFIVSLIIAIPLGIYTATTKLRFINTVFMYISIIIKAIPPFVLGLLLILVFSIWFNLLPPAGFDSWKNFILPSLTLALGLAAVSNRLINNSMNEVQNSSYFKYARYKGLSKNRTIKRHGIKNALIPLLSFLALQSVYLIEGVVVVETIFAFPGIGHALVHAIVARDIPMIQGTIFIMGLLFVLINLLVDILSYILDPRLKERNHAK
ncbi:ABC transporter permease [Arcobacter sp. YIC-464]|uniref:ABC transporter permease n=1 Tax=Arcobacter sp. YIC-464 TaxID=3376631 RepID=UPI003C14FADC